MVYYVTYVEERTGFLKRMEFDKHSEFQEFQRDLKKRGVEFEAGRYK